MKRATAALCAVAALALTPGAAAHKGNPNYESKVDPVELDGLAVQVLSRDDRLELRNDTGKTVLILGYNGEPYARILASGSVQVNDLSPATYLNTERDGEVDIPDRADEKAEPEWRELDGTGRFEWHDHRIHWMGKDRPEAVTDPDMRTKVFDWEVPIRVGARPVELRGTLFWTPRDDGGPPAAALAALAGVALAGLLLIVLVRRRRRASAEPDRGETEAW